MGRTVKIVAAAMMLTLALGVGGAWAIVQITVTGAESKPKTLEIKAGEAVQFVNASGRTAHVSFGGNDAIQLYVEKGGSTIKFQKPGTYHYTVHVTTDRVHSHAGTIVVK